jgi:hemerythrin-like domain-containing protein
MMEATEILMSEHRVIERVIQALETAAKRLELGQPARPGFFVDASDFIKGFADGCHHQKEEGVLFKALVANGMPAQAGPVAVMLYEHEQGRSYTRAMREAAQRLQGDPSARDAVVGNALGYASLLRQHIQKEDGVLFPMADRLLSAEEQQQVTEGFEHVEHEETGEGVHEKYLELAEALEREAASLVTEA